MASSILSTYGDSQITDLLASLQQARAASWENTEVRTALNHAINVLINDRQISFTQEPTNGNRASA